MTDPNQYDTEALRLAAPGPASDDDTPPELQGEQRDLDDLCERWVEWTRTRRFYSPAPELRSVLGQLTGSSLRPLQAGGPDAPNSAELAAFHLAYIGQPDALDKRVFALYYVYRIKPIKSAAAALGISREHFHRVLAAFRSRVFRTSRDIASEQGRIRAYSEVKD
ncbi:hypothetical protein LJR118_000282 [Acidovorax sp. LjRoot118]|uniref:hypothetical protein n=1 Tax=Acidovorax sp. LjRoot118 TaxID=3342256 RepID=UPI003ECC7959